MLFLPRAQRYQWSYGPRPVKNYQNGLGPVKMTSTGHILVNKFPLKNVPNVFEICDEINKNRCLWFICNVSLFLC